MAVVVSVRDSILTMVMAAAMQTEPARISRDGKSMATMPGRRMISAPANPAMSAVVRRSRMVSPSTSTAAREVNSGAVKDSAVAVPIGIMVMPVNQHSMAPRPMAARSA